MLWNNQPESRVTIAETVRVARKTVQVGRLRKSDYSRQVNVVTLLVEVERLLQFEMNEGAVGDFFVGGVSTSDCISGGGRFLSRIPGVFH